MFNIGDLTAQAQSMGVQMKKPNAWDKVKSLFHKDESRALESDGNSAIDSLMSNVKQIGFKDFSSGSGSYQGRRRKNDSAPIVTASQTDLEKEFDKNAEASDPKMYYIIGALVILIIVFRKKLGIKF